MLLGNLKCIIISFPEYSQCVNPRNLKGQCVPIQQCDYLLNVARLSQQNQEARLFLSRSQCGFNGHTPYVCCPQTNQATSQQNSNQQQNKNVIAEKLTNSFLPKPPECGVDLEDRVFGGTQTNIGEFPWFALLKYIRRNCVEKITVNANNNKTFIIQLVPRLQSSLVVDP